MKKSDLEKKKKDDLEEMFEEKRKSTKDLTEELEKAKKDYNKLEETLGKTQILELTRQMKFNLNEVKEDNTRKKGLSKINIIGEINILCIVYYLYLLLFTNYQDIQLNYMITGCIIVTMVLMFGLTVVTSKKVSKFFSLLDILSILSFIAFNIYTLI